MRDGSKSHDYANSFAEALRRSSDIKIVEEGKASTNYFRAEVGGAQIAISPLASHVGWWEKPSVGFTRMRKELGCKWGVVLLAWKRARWMVIGYRDPIAKTYLDTIARFIQMTLK